MKKHWDHPKLCQVQNIYLIKKNFNKFSSPEDTWTANPFFFDLLSVSFFENHWKNTKIYLLIPRFSLNEKQVLWLTFSLTFTTFLFSVRRSRIAIATEMQSDYSTDPCRSPAFHYLGRNCIYLRKKVIINKSPIHRVPLFYYLNFTINCVHIYFIHNWYKMSNNLTLINFSFI